MAKNKFYAVKYGLTPGIYTDWETCKQQIDGFSGAVYKSFKTIEEAQGFLDGQQKSKDDEKQVSATVYHQDDIVCDTPYAFVDGSFNPHTGVYGYGGFLCVGNTKYLLMGFDNQPEMSSMRNVAGEIAGSIAAVLKAEELGLQEITMFYDYKGIEQWATGSWQTNKKTTQEYAQFMQSYERRVNVVFQHVKGHSGVEGNELADVMAKTAVGIGLTKKQQALYDTIDSSIIDIKKVSRPLPSGVEEMLEQELHKCSEHDGLE